MNIHKFYCKTCDKYTEREIKSSLTKNQKYCSPECSNKDPVRKRKIEHFGFGFGNKTN